jgi:hypothetical protein
MTIPKAPKYMQWKPQLTPEYTSRYDLIITGGCSFTASTTQLESAASWPGFLKDRLGLDFCIDMSWPGAGNQYIRDSIFYAVENLVKNQKPLVVVMWSGLDRTEEINNEDDPKTFGCGKINNRYYKRIKTNFSPREYAKMNLNYMMELSEFLTDKDIDHVYTTYFNMTEYSPIPVLDTSPTYYKNLTQTEQKQLEKLPLIITGDRCLYEWFFLNNYESDDMFHPTFEATKAWTDSILAKELSARDFINEIQN